MRGERGCKEASAAHQASHWTRARKEAQGEDGSDGKKSIEDGPRTSINRVQHTRREHFHWENSM